MLGAQAHGERPREADASRGLRRGVRKGLAQRQRDGRGAEWGLGGGVPGVGAKRRRVVTAARGLRPGLEKKGRRAPLPVDVPDAAPPGPQGRPAGGERGGRLRQGAPAGAAPETPAAADRRQSHRRRGPGPGPGPGAGRPRRRRRRRVPVPARPNPRVRAPRPRLMLTRAGRGKGEGARTLPREGGQGRGLTCQGARGRGARGRAAAGARGPRTAPASAPRTAPEAVAAGARLNPLASCAGRRRGRAGGGGGGGRGTRGPPWRERGEGRGSGGGKGGTSGLPPLTPSPPEPSRAGAERGSAGRETHNITQDASQPRAGTRGPSLTLEGTPR